MLVNCAQTSFRSCAGLRPNFVIRALNCARLCVVRALNCARILVLRALDCAQFLLHPALFPTLLEHCNSRVTCHPGECLRETTHASVVELETAVAKVAGKVQEPLW